MQYYYICIKILKNTRLLRYYYLTVQYLELTRLETETYYIHIINIDSLISRWKLENIKERKKIYMKL